MGDCELVELFRDRVLPKFLTRRPAGRHQLHPAPARGQSHRPALRSADRRAVGRHGPGPEPLISRRPASACRRAG
jgi:hypothetical protein